MVRGYVRCWHVCYRYPWIAHHVGYSHLYVAMPLSSHTPHSCNIYDYNLHCIMWFQGLTERHCEAHQSHQLDVNYTAEEHMEEYKVNGTMRSLLDVQDYHESHKSRVCLLGSNSNACNIREAVVITSLVVEQHCVVSIQDKHAQMPIFHNLFP